MREVLRFQPWATAADRALVGFTEGREVQSRVALDALRFGLDEGARKTELERVQNENDRLRGKSHVVWQESLRIQGENDRLRQELTALGCDRQRRPWTLASPWRWLFAVVRRGHRPT
jgi:hypothetical protein